MAIEQVALPKYRQVVNELREEIVSGRLAEGSRAPTLIELQARYKIARGTSEKVYAELAREGLLVRRQGRGTHVAASRPRRTTGLIGFYGTAFDHTQNSYYNIQLVQGIEAAIAAAKVQLIVLRDYSSTGWDQIQGVLMQDADQLELVRLHLPSGIPCVSLLTSRTGISSVVADEFEGARLGIDHLRELGHRRIACLMEPAPGLRMRVTGYRVALAEHGLDAQPEWGRITSDRAWPKQNYRQWAFGNMARWLEDDWDELGCTALIVQNDVAAVGAMHAFYEAGLSVPEQVSVISFDGTEICNCVEPRLTAVEMPLRQIGANGVALLQQHIGDSTLSPRSLVLPTHLVVRGSTAPAPSVNDASVRREMCDAAGVRRMDEQIRWLNLVEEVR